MKAGKISESQLKRSVLKQLHNGREDVLLGPAVGGDFAAVEMDTEDVVIVSASPVVFSMNDGGYGMICEAINDVAVSGAVPVGVLCTVLLPTLANEAQLRELMRDLDVAAAQLQVAILGGHTEVTRAVNEPVISLTGVGKLHKGELVTSAEVKPGMDIILTKWIGLGGTSLLAREKEADLLTRYSAPFIQQAKEFEKYLSIVSEAAAAVKAGASALHNVSRGGVFSALWEMAQASGVGLDIDMKKIPVKQETIEICEFFDINPYKLQSKGALLIAAENGNEVVLNLRREGIEATVIGKATEGNDRILWCEDEKRFLEMPQTDELLKVLG